MFHIIIFILLLIIVGSFALPFLKGGTGFAPSTKSVTNRMITAAKVKWGERAVDIGSGDGRITIALASAGAIADGFEINPLLVWLSRFKIRKLQYKDRIHFYTTDFWKADFSKYQIVTIFAGSSVMKKLESKLQKELPPGARVVVNHFKFPTWKPIEEDRGIFVYIKA